MLYSRYGSGARDVLALPFDEGMELIITAQQANNDEKLFLRWVVSYQTLITYEEFTKKLHTENNDIEDSRSEEEILDSVKKILEGTNGTEYI